ncbi:MAG: prohibitin family protein, partial [Sulfurovum sp.]|nr:prohibitin family protein [Sulfurovum sp.]
MPADMNDYFKKKKPNNSQNNSNDNNGNNNQSFNNPLNNMGGKGASWIFILIAIVFGLFILKPFTIINSGEVGIKVTTGKFQETPLDPGLHFFIP